MVCLVLIFKLVALILRCNRTLDASMAPTSLVLLGFGQALIFLEEDPIVLLSSKSGLQSCPQTPNLFLKVGALKIIGG